MDSDRDTYEDDIESKTIQIAPANLSIDDKKAILAIRSANASQLSFNLTIRIKQYVGRSLSSPF